MHAPAWSRGSRVGRYRLIGELGSGGTAVVFLAVAQGGLAKPLVLKMLRPELGHDDETVGMFLEEAQLASRLVHPNVVQTHEIFEEAGCRFIAMDYVEGQALNIVMQRATETAKPIGLALTLRVVRDVLAGLGAAHDLVDIDGNPLRAVHRDMSPHNVLIGFDGHVKIIDFGLATFTSRSAHTDTGVVKGKVRYMAPEQFTGEVVDHRADLFAVGVVLWELATGQRIWAKQTDAQVMGLLLGHSPIPPPRTAKPELPEALDRICGKALALDREERYQSWAEFQADLEQLGDELKLRATSRDVATAMQDLLGEEQRRWRKMLAAELTEKADETSEEKNSLPRLRIDSHNFTSGSYTHASVDVALATSRPPSAVTARNTKLVPAILVASIALAGAIMWVGRAPRAATAMPPAVAPSATAPIADRPSPSEPPPQPTSLARPSPEPASTDAGAPPSVTRVSRAKPDAARALPRKPASPAASAKADPRAPQTSETAAPAKTRTRRLDSENPWQ